MYARLMLSRSFTFFVDGHPLTVSQVPVKVSGDVFEKIRGMLPVNLRRFLVITESPNVSSTRDLPKLTGGRKHVVGKKEEG